MAKLQSTEVVGTTSVSNPPNGNACFWYDTAERTLKVTFCGFGEGTWSSRNSMATGRASLAGAGTQNAALAFGGWSYPTTYTVTEAYNGSNWASRNSMGLCRCGHVGVGNQNAALTFGGNYSPGQRRAETEAYNGSNWSSRNSMAKQVEGHAGAGTQNAALTFGGYTTNIPSPYYSSHVEAYNGSNWSSRNSMILVRINHFGTGGTQNAALAAGGYYRSGNCTCLRDDTEAYNGSNWSSRNIISSCSVLGGGVGNQNAALMIGALPSGRTEAYNGSNWSVKDPRGVYYGTQAGTQNAALAFGGKEGNLTGLACTEAYVAPTAIITCKLS